MRREIRLAWFLLALIAVPAVQGRQNLQFELSRLSERGREAYFKLQSATMFRLGAVGFTGETSPEELALRNLVSEDQAVQALRSLCRTATAAGRLYGFLGLRERDINAFSEEVGLYRYRSNETKDRTEQVEKSRPPLTGTEAKSGIVLTQSGCLVMGEQSDEILKRIEMGSW